MDDTSVFLYLRTRYSVVLGSFFLNRKEMTLLLKLSMVRLLENSIPL